MDTKVWELSESGWYIRFFLWMWNASPQKLNICKLFWGTVFLPISLFVGIPAAAKRHSVSALAVIYLMIGFVKLCLGLYISAGILLFFVLSFLLGNLIYHRKARKTTVKQKSQFENQDHALNRLTEMMSRLPKLQQSQLGKAIRQILSFIGKVLNYLIFVPTAWLGRKIIGEPALLMIEYIKGVKHKFCPIIVLVPKNGKSNAT